MYSLLLLTNTGSVNRFDVFVIEMYLLQTYVQFSTRPTCDVIYDVIWMACACMRVVGRSKNKKWRHFGWRAHQKQEYLYYLRGKNKKHNDVRRYHDQIHVIFTIKHLQTSIPTHISDVTYKTNQSRITCKLIWCICNRECIC